MSIQIQVLQGGVHCVVLKPLNSRVHMPWFLPGVLHNFHWNVGETGWFTKPIMKWQHTINLMINPNSKVRLQSQPTHTFIFPLQLFLGAHCSLIYEDSESLKICLEFAPSCQQNPTLPPRPNSSHTYDKSSLTLYLAWPHYSYWLTTIII